jgi:predicted regulator of Ras-like GTPase activity (Roadblock/LC7/MglB family)
VDVLAEGVGFEPTEAQKTSTVFETVPFVRSGSLPGSRLARNRRSHVVAFRTTKSVEAAGKIAANSLDPLKNGLSTTEEVVYETSCQDDRMSSEMTVHDNTSWTAPAVTTSFAPPPPPPSAGRAEPTTPVEALDELTEVIEGARGAILASVDGFALARSESMPDEASHAAMLAAAMGLAHQLVVMGGGDQLRQLVIDHDGGLLLLWPIGRFRVLAMLTDARVDQTRLRRYVRSRAALLAEGR